MVSSLRTVLYINLLYSVGSTAILTKLWYIAGKGKAVKII